VMHQSPKSSTSWIFAGNGLMNCSSFFLKESSNVQAADSGRLLGAGRKRHPHCRLHLKLTYLPVGDATMRRAEAADPAAPTDAPGINPVMPLRFRHDSCFRTPAMSCPSALKSSRASLLCHTNMSHDPSPQSGFTPLSDQQSACRGDGVSLQLQK